MQLVLLALEHPVLLVAGCKLNVELGVLCFESSDPRIGSIQCFVYSAQCLSLAFDLGVGEVRVWFAQGCAIAGTQSRVSGAAVGLLLPFGVAVELNLLLRGRHDRVVGMPSSARRR